MPPQPVDHARALDHEVVAVIEQQPRISIACSSRNAAGNCSTPSLTTARAIASESI